MPFIGRGVEEKLKMESRKLKWKRGEVEEKLKAEI
jgi:hypothetical protein